MEAGIKPGPRQLSEERQGLNGFLLFSLTRHANALALSINR